MRPIRSPERMGRNVSEIPGESSRDESDIDDTRA
jgi:hypothetical protein